MALVSITGSSNNKCLFADENTISSSNIELVYFLIEIESTLCLSFSTLLLALRLLVPPQNVPHKINDET